MPKRHVKLLKDCRNQAIRIPREFELPGEDAVMRKKGTKLNHRTRAAQSLLAVVATLYALDEGFPPIRDAPPDR